MVLIFYNRDCNNFNSSLPISVKCQHLISNTNNQYFNLCSNLDGSIGGNLGGILSTS